MFFDNLLKYCDIAGYKLTPLVVSLGISKGSVTRWKNGTIPNGATLHKLASALNVSVDELLGAEKEKAPTDNIDERDVFIDTIILKYRQMTPDQKKEFIYKLNLILDPSLDPKRLEAMIRLLKPDQPSDQ